jgi:streptogramin lyase
MSLRRQVLGRIGVFSVLLGLTGLATAQTTTVAAGTLRSTDSSRLVTGVRIEPRPDGSVWFLIPLNDRIVQLQPDGVTFKQWQIRQDKDLGANPVDFEIDGDVVWFIENGASLIDAGYSALGRLDTKTGQLREWAIPGAKPAGFWRAPDGQTVWIPQTNGRLQSLNLTTLQVLDYRSTKTFAYSDVVFGSDGALWMADFGDNRIVRYEPGAATETSWTFFDPNLGRINPTQIQFDANGKLWISELSVGRMDRFDPVTGVLAEYTGFNNPIHFDIFNGRIYVAEAPSTNGTVTVLDPSLATVFGQVLTSETLEVKSTVNKLATKVLDSTITPTNFTTTVTTIADADLIISTGGVGLLRTQFPATNAYGISAAGGGVWVGSGGNLVRLTLQNIGTSADLTVPVAATFGVSPGQRIRIDVTLFNQGGAPISGDALLLFSPGSFAPRTTFTVNPGQTVFLSDAFAGASSNSGLTLGPVRLRVTTGTASDLVASVRTARIADDGSSFGFALPALSGAQAVGAGSSRTLFTDPRAGTASVLGIYAVAPSNVTATLLAPDGTVRGSQVFVFDSNISEEFNPAASAFGVSPQAGDVVRLTVNSGSIQSYINVLDTGTSDVATSLPVAARNVSIFPNVGEIVGQSGRSFLSDLFLSNPDSGRAASVTVTFAPLASQDLLTATVTLAPNESRVISDVLPTLFPITQGQGALGVSADIPIAASVRVAARTDAGDYGNFAPAFDPSDAIPDAAAAFAFDAPQTATRRTDLFLFNDGNGGTVTVIGYDANGSEIGRFSIEVGPRQATRVNAVLATMGVSDNQGAGRIRIETSPGMRLFAETAVADASGDVDITRLRPAQ